MNKILILIIVGSAIVSSQINAMVSIVDRPEEEHNVRRYPFNDVEHKVYRPRGAMCAPDFYQNEQFGKADRFVIIADAYADEYGTPIKLKKVFAAQLIGVADANNFMKKIVDGKPRDDKDKKENDLSIYEGLRCWVNGLGNLALGSAIIIVSVISAGKKSSPYVIDMLNKVVVPLPGKLWRML